MATKSYCGLKAEQQDAFDSKQTQRLRILQYMLDGNAIDSIKAEKSQFGRCRRLASRIDELRNPRFDPCYPIKDRWVKSTKNPRTKWKEYFFEADYLKALKK